MKVYYEFVIFISFTQILCLIVLHFHRYPGSVCRHNLSLHRDPVNRKAAVLNSAEDQINSIRQNVDCTK